MMKTRLLIYALLLFSSCNCEKNDLPNDEIEPDPVNKLLMLQVDYTSNELIGVRELTFERQSSTFTITTEQQPPNDIGFIKLRYKELDKLIFYGTQIFIGTGKIIIPDGFSPARNFETGESINTPSPANGFDVVGGSNIATARLWNAVKHMSLVKKYMQLNPKQKVKILLYSPAAGFNWEKTSQWIMILKN